MKFKIDYDFGSNFVVTAIHNGHFLRNEVRQNIAISETERLREEDPYTEFFTEGYGNKIIVETSRFEVDLNRSREKCVYLRPEDAWGLKVRKQSPTNELINISKKYYDIFYKSVNAFLKELLEYHKRIIVLDIHSFNHHRCGHNKPFDPQEFNPDIDIGTSVLKGKNLLVAENFVEELSNNQIDQRKIDCRMNVKFSGGNFPVWLNSNFDKRIIAISIEFKKIFMDEWSGNIYPEVQTQLKRILDNSIKKAEFL